MAEAYLAKQFGPDGYEKPCVLKRINKDAEQDPTHRKLFLEEARLSGLLNHPFIVQTFDYGEEDGVPFMAMELVEGTNLATLLKRMREKQERFPLRAAVELGQAMLEALGYAHRLEASGRHLGVVHRDVSPHNILLSRQGIAKLADFGVARKERDEGSTIGAQVKGKTAYMSKEQALGEPLDGRADLFSLGLVLVEVLAGERVAEGSVPLSLIDYRPRVDSLLAARADLPKALASLISWMVAERPSDRPPDAESAADLLRRMKEDLPARDSLARFLPMSLEHHGALDGGISSGASTPARALDRTNVDPGHPAAPKPHIAQEDLEDPSSPSWLIAGSEMNRADAPPTDPRPSTAQGWTDILGDESEAAALRSAAPNGDARPWMAQASTPAPPPPSGDRLPLPTGGRPPSASIPVAAGMPLNVVGTGPEGESIDRLRTMFVAGRNKPESPAVVRVLMAIAGLGAIVAIVLFARAGVFSFGDGDLMTGRLTVESDPPGAQIWLDGKLQAAVTPTELTELRVDRAMLLEVKKDGFIARPDKLMVEIPNDEFKSSRAKFGLHPARALHISTIPPGAEVELEGKKLPGRTPLVLPTLSDGQNVALQLRLNGHLPASLSIAIGSDTATVTEVVLEKSTSLDIDVEPSGAAVSVNGAVIGRAPLYAVAVPAERPFVLKVEHPGFKSQERKIDPRRMKETKLELRLAALPFSALPISPEDRKRISDLERRVLRLRREVSRAEAKLRDREATYERVSTTRGVSSGEMATAISNLESARSQLAGFEREHEEAREDLQAIKFELSERNRSR